MPEKLGVTLEGKNAETDTILQSIADGMGATIVTGVMHGDAPVQYNEARIYLPHSEMRRYDKQHMHSGQHVGNSRSL